MPIDQEKLRKHIAFVKGKHQDGRTFYAPYFSFNNMQADLFLCNLPIDKDPNIALEFRNNVSCANISIISRPKGGFQLYALLLKNETLKQADTFNPQALEKKDHIFLSAHMSEDETLQLTPIAFKYSEDESMRFELCNSQNNAPIFVTHETIMGITILGEHVADIFTFPEHFTQVRHHAH